MLVDTTIVPTLAMGSAGADVGRGGGGGGAAGGTGSVASRSTTSPTAFDIGFVAKVSPCDGRGGAGSTTVLWACGTSPGASLKSTVRQNPTKKARTGHEYLHHLIGIASCGSCVRGTEAVLPRWELVHHHRPFCHVSVPLPASRARGPCSSFGKNAIRSVYDSIWGGGREQRWEWRIIKRQEDDRAMVWMCVV